MFKNFIVSAVCVLLIACNPLKAPDEAVAQIDRFHERYNAGEDDAIWKGFGPEMALATPRETFDNLLSAERDALGQMKASDQVGINYQTNTNGRFLFIVMRTTFEKGVAQETFTFKGSDEQRRLIGYRVDSQAMMDKMMEDAAAQRNSQEKAGATAAD